MSITQYPSTIAWEYRQEWDLTLVYLRNGFLRVAEAYTRDCAKTRTRLA